MKPCSSKTKASDSLDLSSTIISNHVDPKKIKSNRYLDIPIPGRSFATYRGLARGKKYYVEPFTDSENQHRQGKELSDYIEAPANDDPRKYFPESFLWEALQM